MLLDRPLFVETHLLTSKLSEKRESHPDGTNFGWEDFRNIEVHGRIAEGPRKVSTCIVSLAWQ